MTIDELHTILGSKSDTPRRHHAEKIYLTVVQNPRFAKCSYQNTIFRIFIVRKFVYIKKNQYLCIGFRKGGVKM